MLDKHQPELKALAQSLLDEDAEAFTRGMVELLTNLSTEAPILGALVKHAAAKAFASSSNAKLSAELAAIEREEDRQSFADQIAEPIEQLVGDLLHQLTNAQHDATEDVIGALGGLREEFESFRADYARRGSAASVTVDEMQVSGQGTGIQVDSQTNQTAEVKVMRVRGKGTGIVLGKKQS